MEHHEWGRYTVEKSERDKNNYLMTLLKYFFKLVIMSDSSRDKIDWLVVDEIDWLNLRCIARWYFFSVFGS